MEINFEKFVFTVEHSKGKASIQLDVPCKAEFAYYWANSLVLSMMNSNEKDSLKFTFTATVAPSEQGPLRKQIIGELFEEKEVAGEVVGEFVNEHLK